jgi:hypothetical protein
VERRSGIGYLFLHRTIIFAFAAGMPARAGTAFRLQMMDSDAVGAAAGLFRFTVVGGAAVGHLLFYRTIVFTITIRIATRIRSAFWRGLTMMNGFTVVTTARLH